MARLRKRYLWWLAAALAVIALGVGLVLVEPQPPVNRVRNGMTHEEVILAPPDRVEAWWSDGLPVYAWRFGDGSCLFVYMNGADRVQCKEFYPGPEPEWRKRLRALGAPI
jgi:hypothetical protein